MMPAGGRPRDLKPGDSPFKGPLDAAQWSTVAQTVRSIRAGKKPGRSTQGGGGAQPRGRPSGRVTIGIIDSSDRSTGDGWPDFSDDNRYWVRVWTNEGRAAHGAASPDVIEELHVDSIADYSLQVPATNLAERRSSEQSGGTHLLADGTVVQLWQVIVGTEIHWVFWHAPEADFPAVILDAEPIDDEEDPVLRWKYEWAEVDFTGDSYSIRTDGRTGTFADTANQYALNIDEMGQTGQYVAGVDIEGTDYAASSYTPKPIGGGGTDQLWHYPVVVWMKMRMVGGAMRYYFSKSNSHDGNC